MKLAFATALAALMAAPAFAAEPLTLTAAELDTISAAGNRLEVDITGDNISNGVFFFDNLPGVFSDGEVEVSTTVISGTVTSFIRLESDTFD